tara:strand:- start:203 stop:496 length:294 start_codon:yes stop_codon:yes gene_type:complete
MKLRSGFVYEYLPTIERPNKDNEILLGQCCDICKLPYKKNTLVVSCKHSNLLKHNFHNTCLQKHIKCNLYQFYSSGHFDCPYCLERLNKFNLAKIYL